MDYPGKVITKTQVTPTQTSASGNWTLDDQAAAIKNNNWPVALVPNPISKSLRFNSADSAYLNRTPASAGNRKTWTWSGWVKRGTLGSAQVLLSSDVGTSNTTFLEFGFDAADTFTITSYTTDLNTTAAVFRDPSAWYHIVVAFDSTQATSANRCKIYVNGTQQTLTGVGFTLNADYGINNAQVHGIGYRNWSSGVGRYFNGYMTEINFIDGQALTPSDFGLTNPQTGQWIPKKYTGTYGTNGFYLNFKDATSTTTLGYDYSGNANNWTTNNFSVTAGSGNDSLTDVPTPWVAYNTTGDVGGVIRGNYCTLNPISSSAIPTLTNGNLDTPNNQDQKATSGTIGVSSGKWYWEVTVNNDSKPCPYLGVTNRSQENNPDSAPTLANNAGRSVVRLANNYVYKDYTATGGISTGATAQGTNGTVGIALDFDAGEIKYYKNNSLFHTDSTIPTSGVTLFPYFGITFSGGGGWNSSAFNFGQRPFAYTPPAGFRSLCTTNLPATAIGFGLTNQADDYFNANLYTGTGSAFTLTGVGFQPDFGWFKGRNASSNHWLHDVVRGANPGLSSNSTAAEDTTAGQLTAFASDGYSLPNDTAGYLNFSGRTMVVWSWKAGGTGVTNTAGTITSTVSANTTAGFSIVTYTGNGVDGATTGHGLGVAPNMVIVKRRDVISDWNTKHSSLSSNNVVFLNNTSAQQTPGSGYIGNLTSSTVITLVNGGAAITNVNGNGSTYVAYCFAAVPGYSAFGSYTGNGSADGPFVFTNFRPKFIFWKNASTTSDWQMKDAARSTYNVTSANLYANLSTAENSAGDVDFLSNGFKLRSAGTDVNGSGNTIIYAAFAESPFQFSNAR